MHLYYESQFGLIFPSTYLPTMNKHILKIDPLSRPTITAESDYCFYICYPDVPPYVRTSVPTFQNLTKQTNFKRKQCLLLVGPWVWSSGSLMTPVLYILFLQTWKQFEKIHKAEPNLQMHEAMSFNSLLYNVKVM